MGRCKCRSADHDAPIRAITMVRRTHSQARALTLSRPTCLFVGRPGDRLELDPTFHNDLVVLRSYSKVRAMSSSRALIDYGTAVDARRLLPNFIQRRAMRTDVPEALGRLRRYLQAVGNARDCLTKTRAATPRVSEGRNDSGLPARSGTDRRRPFARPLTRPQRCSFARYSWLAGQSCRHRRVHPKAAS